MSNYENKYHGKPVSIKSEQAALKTLVLLLADEVLQQTVSGDPKERSQLLSAYAAVHGGKSDTGWVKGGDCDEA